MPRSGETAAVSPLARRYKLGAAIQALRGNQKREEVAARAGVDPSVLSKIQAGERRSGLETILRVLDAIPLDQHSPEYQQLQTVARDALKRGWWDDPEYKEMGVRQVRTADLECGATIREYQTSMLPGLLQTEEYARYRGQVALDKGISADLDAVVRGRLRRQQQITGPDATPYHALLEPQAILRNPVPATVMGRQLHHLLTLMKADHITIRVLPVDARLPEGMVPRTPFSIYTYGPDDLVLVAVDTIQDDIVITSPEQAADYMDTFDALHRTALSCEESAQLIQRAADEVAAT